MGKCTIATERIRHTSGTQKAETARVRNADAEEADKGLFGLWLMRMNTVRPKAGVVSCASNCICLRFSTELSVLMHDFTGGFASIQNGILCNAGFWYANSQLSPMLYER